MNYQLPMQIETVSKRSTLTIYSSDDTPIYTKVESSPY